MPLDDLRETHKFAILPYISLIKCSTILVQEVTKIMRKEGQDHFIFDWIKMFHWFLSRRLIPVNRRFYENCHKKRKRKLRHRHGGATPLFYELFMTFTTFFLCLFLLCCVFYPTFKLTIRLAPFFHFPGFLRLF